ncbi:hypothetical protein KQI82_03885 [Oscillibacter sp. MSJ-2]|uniref:ATPase n=1 Tax=Dysosmobacter acutus TaxID=2841504 RepID=A0ABS6F957_9FIRM|nr:hypothetical protein [Dysosmobacter acutus]MBU5626077.1 hypothetical protein [Dysosmobacter acutus]
MDKIIQELVAIDRQAREAVRSAQQRSEAERAEIVREKEALSACYRKRAEQKAQALEKAAGEEAERSILQLEKAHQTSLQDLEDRFDRQRQQWIDEIVTRCIQL